MLFFFTASAGEVAQPAESPDEILFPAETVRGELRHLYETLAAAHFDLYAYRSREAYDRYYEELAASIDTPMTRLDVVRLFTPFVTFGKVGHARIDFPVQDYIAYAMGGGTLLPLDIRVENGRVLVARNYSGMSVLGPGTELVALNGRSATEWIDHIGRLVSAERPYMVHAQLESMFSRLVWLDQGQLDSFRVTVRSLAGTEATVAVEALPVIQIEEQKGALERQQHSRHAELLVDGIAYLRPGPFYAVSEDESLETFETFIDEAFRDFVDSGATDLIIDLRNNPGGDNSFSDPMIAWFADEPFSFASQFLVKASEQTREVLRGLAKRYPGGISAEMLEAMKRQENGTTFAFEIPKAQPSEAGFSGRVWALVNRHSYSNATTVAAIIQDYGFGVVIGEETADVPTSYASSAQFTLPETGIAITYPKAYFVRPSGDETLHGVIPDHVLEFVIAADDEGTLLRRVQEYIISQRL